MLKLRIIWVDLRTINIIFIKNSQHCNPWRKWAALFMLVFSRKTKNDSNTSFININIDFSSNTCQFYMWKFDLKQNLYRANGLWIEVIYFSQVKLNLKFLSRNKKVGSTSNESSYLLCSSSNSFIISRQ